jgi:hypothetical protein|tara:strand:- start:133460 stop:133924 length:465 start_codon:yes stop_codon:yes gene_type:complete
MCLLPRCARQALKQRINALLCISGCMTQTASLCPTLVKLLQSLFIRGLLLTQFLFDTSLHSMGLTQLIGAFRFQLRSQSVELILGGSANLRNFRLVTLGLGGNVFELTFLASQLRLQFISLSFSLLGSSFERSMLRLQILCQFNELPYAGGEKV